MNSIKKNIVYNLFYQILAIILPFITAPYLSRVIGASGVGLYSFSHSIALNFTYITLLGLTNYGNRAIAAVQNDVEKRSKLFCEIYAMQCCCFLVSLTLYAVYIVAFSADYLAACIMILTVASSLFDINWFFFGMEQFKLTVIRNTVIKVLTVICVFIFVKDQNDIYIYIAIMSLGFLASQLCLWPFLKKFVYFYVPKWKDFVRHFKPNLILFVPVIAVSIYKMLDKIFLGYMSTMEQVGYFENAERIITVSVTLITAVGTVMLPRTTSMLAEHKNQEGLVFLDKTMMLVLAYANAVFFGILAVANEFSVIYYGEDFTQTGVIMQYLAVTVIFLGCGNVVRTQYLIPMHEDKVYLKSAVFGAIINAAVNILLIPKLEAVGAAIGTIFAEVFVCCYQVFAVRKKLNIKKYCKWELVFGLIGCLMFLLVKLVPVPSSGILALGERVVLGAVFYLVVTYIYLRKFENFKIKLLK